VILTEYCSPFDKAIFITSPARELDLCRVPYFRRRRPVIGSGGFADAVQLTKPLDAPKRYAINPAGAETVPPWKVRVLRRALGFTAMA
jgi:hypothetical protein